MDISPATATGPVSAGTAYLVERLRRRHPAAAVIAMIAIDSASALVVMHNARAANYMAARRR